MKVLVTGATGFIGNHVVKELLRRGVEVVASSSNLVKAKTFDWFDNVSYVELDISNIPKNPCSFFLNPDKVIHLAWQGLPNYKDLFHLENNLPINYQFIKSLVMDNLSDITITGTCFEYGMQNGELTEEMLTMPSNAYGLAKDSLRKFLEQLQIAHFFNLKWVRLFYMYGEGQHENSLISQLNKSIASGESTFRMSGGEQLRDYMSVSEVANNIVSISIQQKEHGIINCCSGKPVSIRSFIETYLKERQENIELNMGFYPYTNFEPMAFWGNNCKLKKITE